MWSEMWVWEDTTQKMVKPLFKRESVCMPQIPFLAWCRHLTKKAKKAKVLWKENEATILMLWPHLFFMLHIAGASLYCSGLLIHIFRWPLPAFCEWPSPFFGLLKTFLIRMARSAAGAFSEPFPYAFLKRRPLNAKSTAAFKRRRKEEAAFLERLLSTNQPPKNILAPIHYASAET